MIIRAVLFDVGGPIDTEVRHEEVCDEYILKALRTVGVNANQASLAEASDWAVDCFAPQAYAAMIWRLCGGDTTKAQEAHRLFEVEWAEERVRVRGGLELRPGIGEVLRSLHERGVLMGLAANQPPR